MIEIEARLDELEGPRPAVAALGWSAGRRGRTCCSTASRCCCCARTTTWASPTTRACATAAADAAMRWGVGAGASRLVSGTMTIHRRLEERLAAFKGREAALLFGSGYLANIGVIAALARPGDVVFSDELNHASIIDGCRLSRAEVFVYDHCDLEHLAWGIEQAEGRGALIVTDCVFSMDGDVAPLEEIVELAAAPPAAAARRRGARHRRARPRRSRRRRRGRARGRGRRDRRHARQGARLLRRVRRVRPRDGPLPAQRRAHVHLLDRAPAARGRRRAGRARPARGAAPRACSKLAANAAALRAELAREGFDVRGSPTQIIPLIVGDPALAVRICEAALARGVFAQAIRPPTVPASDLAAAPGGDGVSPRGGAAGGGPHARPGRSRRGLRAAGRLQDVVDERAGRAHRPDPEPERQRQRQRRREPEPERQRQREPEPERQREAEPERARRPAAHVFDFEAPDTRAA